MSKDDLRKDKQAIKKSGFRFETASQRELQQSTKDITIDGATVTGERFEDTPLVENPTVSPARLVYFGPGPLNLTGEALEIHGQRSSLDELLKNERLQEAVRAQLRITRRGLERRGQ